MPAFLAGPLLKYAIIGLIIAGLGATIYVYHLKLAAAQADARAAHAELNTCSIANADFAEKFAAVTQDAAAFEKRAQEAEAAAAATKAMIVTRVETQIKEIKIHATPADNMPVTPALRAALSGVRQ